MQQWRRDAAGVSFLDVVKFLFFIAICCPLPVVVLNLLNDQWNRPEGAPAADTGSGAESGSGAEDVVRWYLDAAMHNRDPSATAEMTCDRPDLGEVDGWREELARREAASGTELIPESVDVEVQSESDDSATVSAVMTVSSERQRLQRTFEFSVVRADDEWQVCTASVS
jgi:hypothetical protein